MTSIAPVQPASPVRFPMEGGAQAHAAEAEPFVRGPAPKPEAAAVEILLVNAALESYYASLYDPRTLHPDPTPRGVEIDRIEMIKEGFDHLRELIQAITKAAADDFLPSTDIRL
ncbi:hypothetical protein [Mangrovicoccus sp. HB161399]|uniref:hypothetical protein n=1 Tax=Mangrovicoccus sp. HB161399 TaxID=2720392 RepID=UPI0015559CFA|nr:hypothetical protein [Mangrovicoccus sp. HB161399]